MQSTAGGRNTCPGMAHVFGDLLIRDYLSVRSTNEWKAIISIEGNLFQAVMSRRVVPHDPSSPLLPDHLPHSPLR